MKKIKYYQVDSFTNKLFGGNPAGVCPLENWIDEDMMQNIAMENNLSETVFFVKNEDIFEIRWFTPTVEIDLAGHPTLATAYVIFNILDYKKPIITFRSHLSGDLMVRNEGKNIVMNFPSRKPEAIESPESLIKALHIKPVEVLQSRDMMAVLKSEEELIAISPDFNLLSEVSDYGVIITARGNQTDFVSRFFAPKMGINEDPVTGSAHSTLIPYWAEKLDKVNMHARQLSKRGGELFCCYLGDRVEISGEAVLFMEGEIYV